MAAVDRIEQDVTISLADLISYDIEELNDLVEERIGRGLLGDIDYRAVKVDGNGDIVLRVTAAPAE